MDNEKGKIYMVPNTLGGESTNDIIPSIVAETASKLRAFAVEDIKSARRLLRKIDREFPIDTTEFFFLNKHTAIEDLQTILKVIHRGQDIGVISEAGCPGIADPGAELVALAQQRNIQIVPLVGPSSILLALMASGFSGQNFTFHGYLPKERKDRVRKLKDFEGDFLALFNENGFLEIALYKSNPKTVGSASTLLGIKFRDTITVEFKN
jgi:16S rRNA (cytidine1402-2'-O)-methyltransferase